MSKREPGSLSLGQKLGYGVGDLGGNFCWTFVAAFILYYCTSTLGISGGVVGTLIAISKVLDGITDVFMGQIIDHTKSKMGKARFWLFISAFPLAILTYFIFNIPASFTENTKYVVFFITYTVLGAIVYTMSNIAYSTLMALCTKNPKDRVQMGSFRYIFAMIAGIAIQSVTLNMVEQFGGGQQGWRTVSLIFAVLCFIFLMIPVLCVRELPEEELETKKVEEAPKEKLSFWKTLKLLVTNKYFILILLYYFQMYILSFTPSSLGAYYVQIVLNDSTALGKISMVSYIPTVIVMTFVASLTKKFGMRNTALVGHCIALVGTTICFVGGMWFKNPLMFILVGLFIRGIGMAPMSGSINAFIAAADDYSAAKTGYRITGAFFSCSSVGIKVGTGLGTALAGFIVDAATSNPENAVAIYKWGYLLPTLLFPLCTIIILLFMDVEKKTAELKAQKAE